jgi:hypothetical protein
LSESASANGYGYDIIVNNVMESYFKAVSGTKILLNTQIKSTTMTGEVCA